MSGRLIRSTLVTGSMTLVSRISGLVRDVVLASFIGASATVAADAFYVAFRIPNFFRRIFGEGAFSQAFVPVLSEYRSREELAAIRVFIAHMSATLGLILVAVVVVGMLLAPGVVTVLAPGFLDEAEKFASTVTMLRITFPYLLFISLVAMAGGIMNAWHRFAVPAFTPVLLNLCMIAAALGLAPLMDGSAVALAWGVFAAGIAQLLFQLPALKRLGLLVAPRPGWRDPGVRRVFRLMIPAIVGSSVAQINLLINTLLASFLVTGSVSWLYYSDRLMEFPLGIFGIALATVILPALSDTHHRRSAAEFSSLLDWALRWVMLIGLPAAVALVLLAVPLVATLFQYGAFTAHDVDMAARSLVAFAIGLPGLILVKVLAPGFFARQDTRTPAKVAVLAVSVNIVMSLLLFMPLAHVGLALAVTIAAYVNCATLFWLLRRDGVYVAEAGWPKYLLQIGAATLGMGGVLWYGSGDLAQWTASGLAQRLLHLGALVAAGLVSYFLLIVVTGVPLRKMLNDRRLSHV